LELSGSGDFGDESLYALCRRHGRDFHRPLDQGAVAVLKRHGDTPHHHVQRTSKLLSKSFV
jgi:hypothetical protein